MPSKRTGDESLFSVHAQTSEADTQGICIWNKRCQIVDLLTAFWQVLISLYIQTVTRKQLNWLQNAFFGKFPRENCVNVRHAA